MTYAGSSFVSVSYRGCGLPSSTASRASPLGAGIRISCTSTSSLSATVVTSIINNCSPPFHPCRQTAQCKLQQELLECVGVLSLKLQVSTANLERLAHACAPYLASDQPDILQQACLTCFQNLIDLDPDTMWLLLEQLRSEGGGTTPPSSALKPYKLPSCPDRDKYRDNVNILIHRT